MVGINKSLQEQLDQKTAEYNELLDDYKKLEKYVELIERENNDLAWNLAGYEGAYK